MTDGCYLVGCMTVDSHTKAHNFKNWAYAGPQKTTDFALNLCSYVTRALGKSTSKAHNKLDRKTESRMESAFERNLLLRVH